MKKDLVVRVSDVHLDIVPLFTEKSMKLQEDNIYLFSCNLKSIKSRVKGVLERYTGVKILKISSLIRKGKAKKFKGVSGVKSNKKFMFIKFADKVSIGLE